MVVMFVYVLNRHGQPLMPTSPGKARLLLKTGHAKVVRRTPFTIKLVYGSSGYRQDVVAGMDAGSRHLGTAAVANGEVVYTAEVRLRDDISGKLEQRRMYRRNRRNRKTRYRPARFENRASMRATGRLAPSIRSKVESHLRERRFVESILPVTHWRVELASFDIHRIVNPDVAGTDYQKGPLKDWYNVKAYVLHRDGYHCQSGQKVRHSPKLNVHHIQFRSQGGGNSPTNLLTLCKTCHHALHRSEFTLKAKPSVTKHATEIGIIQASLQKTDWVFEPTFGYETRYKREQFLKLPKSHWSDAVAICLEDGETVEAPQVVIRKRHLAKGDYQQTAGAHSQHRIPTGKLFGLRKFDLVKTIKGIGFVKGKRSTGYFALCGLDGTTITPSVTVKRDCQRLAARSTTLLQLERSGASSRLSRAEFPRRKF